MMAETNKSANPSLVQVNQQIKFDVEQKRNLAPATTSDAAKEGDVKRLPHKGCQTATGQAAIPAHRLATR
jgi:hypothetical protein